MGTLNKTITQQEENNIEFNKKDLSQLPKKWNKIKPWLTVKEMLLEIKTYFLIDNYDIDKMNNELEIYNTDYNIKLNIFSYNENSFLRPGETYKISPNNTSNKKSIFENEYKFSLDKTNLKDSFTSSKFVNDNYIGIPGFSDNYFEEKIANWFKIRKSNLKNEIEYSINNLVDNLYIGNKTTIEIKVSKNSKMFLQDQNYTITFKKIENVKLFLLKLFNLNNFKDSNSEEIGEIIKFALRNGFSYSDNQIGLANSLNNETITFVESTLKNKIIVKDTKAILKIPENNPYFKPGNYEFTF